MSSVPNSYRFGDARHWQTGVLSGLQVAKDGALLGIERLRREADVITDAYATFTPVINSAGRTLWRAAPQAVETLNELGEVCSSAPANAQLLRSPRWVADRNVLWAFDPERPQVLRFDIETLHLDDVIEVAPLYHGECVNLAVLDIAVDGRQGLWLLLVVDEATVLLHLDCRGERLQQLQLSALTHPQAFTVLSGAAVIVVLAGVGGELHFFDLQGVATRPALSSTALNPDLSVELLAGNGRDRVILSGRSAAADAPARLLIIDARGNLIDGPLDMARLDRSAVSRVHGLAGVGSTVLVATGQGVLRFAADSGNEGPGNHGYFITPALQSPQIDTRRGWLRAEIELTIPSGAVLEARVFSTADEHVLNFLNEVFRDPARSNDERRRLLHERLGAAPERHFVFGEIVAPTIEVDAQSRVPLTVPLFAVQEPWLWLELALDSAPGSATVRLEELRVLYPEVSLIESLPAIYRGVKNDPRGTLRGIVGVIESTTQQLDARIRQISSVLDPDTAPPEWLNFIARWLDVPWDDGLPVAVKRELLRAVPQLLGQRGTRAGLQVLLDALFGPRTALITDVTSDVGVVRLGGGACRGMGLPALLAGASRRAAVLGEKAVLGRARLPCDSGAADPLAGLSSQVQIAINAAPAVRSSIEPVLRAVLAQFLPAEIQLRVRWRSGPGTSFMLDEPSRALREAERVRLSEASPLGHSTLGGKLATRLTDPGGSLRLQL